MNNQFQLIREWAKDRGILDKGDSKTQYIKLQEEAGELAKAILKNDRPEIIDALGDCVVVLVNLAALEGYKLEDCVETAYRVISSRKGKMKNGTFMKQTTLELNQAKKVVVLKAHKNGYFNLPCKRSEINEYMKDNSISINGKVYNNSSEMLRASKPSINGGVAYVYPTDL